MLSKRTLGRAVTVGAAALTASLAAFVSAPPAGAAGSAWTWSTPASVDPYHAIVSLSCNNVVCVGVDDAGRIVQSYGQTPTSTTWAPVSASANDWTVGNYGVRFLSAHCSDASDTRYPICLAVGSGYAMQWAVYPQPTAQVVQPQALPWNVSLSAVACPAGGVCIGGGFWDVSAIYWLGSTANSPTSLTTGWNLVTRDLNDDMQDFTGVTRLDCPTASLCIGAYAIGDSPARDVYDLVVGSGDLTDPSAWQFTGQDVGLTSCSSANLCGSYDPGEQQAEFTSTPTDPESWSTNTFVEPFFDSVSAVDCTAQGSCLVGDDGGHIFISNSPTTYGTPWLAQTVDPGNTITAISCTSDGTECVVGDSGGNVLVGTRSVADTTPPVIANVPSDATVEAAGPSGARYTYTNPTASDDTDGPVPVSCEPASGSTFPLGDTTVTCTATDKAGNRATATFAVHVVDTTPPTLTVPSASVVADATTPDGGVATYAATANDLVDGAVTPSCSPSSGSLFPVGDTTVTCTATDKHGNTSPPQTFGVHIRGAAEQLQDLVGAVTGSGPGRSLAAKLNSISTAAAAGQTPDACSELGAFVNEVEAQSGKSIGASEATELVIAAERIEAVLGC